MPTDKRFLESLRNDLLQIFAEVAKEDPRPPQISFPDPEWRLYDLGPYTLIYRRRETDDAIQRFEQSVMGNAEWRAKWSAEYIRNSLRGALHTLGDRSLEHIDNAFGRLAEALDAEPRRYRVIFAISGVSLEEPEINIGNIRLFPMNDQEQERLRAVMARVIARVRDGDDVKPHFSAQTEEWLKTMKPFTIAEISADGDPKRAKEEAWELCGPVADFLQIIAAIDDQNAQNIRVVLGGGTTALNVPLLIISNDETEVHWEINLSQEANLVLSQARIDKVVGYGFQPLVATVAKANSQRSDYEKLLLNAAHWMADAEKQEQAQNRITSYMTAMELFFTSDGGSIVRDLSESIAYLLNDDLNGRRERRDLVKRLYKARSAISHGGKVDDADEIARKLKPLALSVLAKLSNFADRFETKENLRSFFADLRLGGRLEQ